jgi:hypothetical protein
MARIAPPNSRGANASRGGGRSARLFRGVCVISTHAFVWRMIGTRHRRDLSLRPPAWGMCNLASQLEYDDEHGQRRVVSLSGQEILIGRLPQCAIRLLHDTVGRLHARVAYRDGQYWIEDCGSDNGTWVNGKRIESHRLRANDVIQCGLFRLRYVDNDG